MGALPLLAFAPGSRSRSSILKARDLTGRLLTSDPWIKFFGSLAAEVLVHGPRATAFLHRFLKQNRLSSPVEITKKKTHPQN